MVVKEFDVPRVPGDTITVCVGDVHNKWPQVSGVLADAPSRFGSLDRVVFLGDYVNNWGDGADNEIASLAGLVEWVRTARRSGVVVDCLVGNHDLPYTVPLDSSPFQRIVSAGAAPGFQFAAHMSVSALLKELRLQVATTIGDTVVSHAGFTSAWVARHADILDGEVFNENTVAAANRLLAHEHLTPLIEIPPSRGGQWVGGCPLWADSKDLIADTAPVPQIVGHSPVETVHTAQGENTNVSLTFTDTFSTFSDGHPIGDGSVLIVQTLPDGSQRQFKFRVGETPTPLE